MINKQDLINDMLPSLSCDDNLSIGMGFDVHELVEGRKLIMGGVKIDHYKGLLGHSDADVLTHAIMDALLSASGYGDIGTLFPDNDNSYKGADSIELLKIVMQKLEEKGKTIQSISCVIMAQKPKMSLHIHSMRQTLAIAMNISIEKINISATTTEHLGVIGEEKGIGASAVCLLCTKMHNQ